MHGDRPGDDIHLMRSPRTRFISFAIALFVPLAVALGFAAPGHAAQAAVGISNQQFTPKSITVTAGSATYVYSGVRVSQLDFARGDAAAVFVFATSIVIALAYLRIFRSGGTGEEA